MCINAIPDAPITADGEPIDLVEEFTFLEALSQRTLDIVVQEDTKARLRKTPACVEIEVVHYKSMTKPVLMHDSECWRTRTLPSTAARHNGTLGSRGYFFQIDISRRSRVNETQSAEEKK